MNYHIEKNISPMDFGFLKSLIGEELRLISIQPFSNGSSTNHRKVSFSNDIVVEKGGDEYFCEKVKMIHPQLLD